MEVMKASNRLSSFEESVRFRPHVPLMQLTPNCKFHLWEDFTDAFSEMLISRHAQDSELLARTSVIPFI